jgi:hypothetical protein
MVMTKALNDAITPVSFTFLHDWRLVDYQMVGGKGQGPSAILLDLAQLTGVRALQRGSSQMKRAMNFSAV